LQNTRTLFKASARESDPASVSSAELWQACQAKGFVSSCKVYASSVYGQVGDRACRLKRTMITSRSEASNGSTSGPADVIVLCDARKNVCSCRVDARARPVSRCKSNRPSLSRQNVATAVYVFFSFREAFKLSHAKLNHLVQCKFYNLSQNTVEIQIGEKLASTTKRKRTLYRQ
jgi:hypothetical protein